MHGSSDEVGETDDVVVRACSHQDLHVLRRDLPTGLADVHGQHLERQDAGLRTYLGAFTDEEVRGTCVVSWDGCREPEVRQAFPTAVEIAGLQVGDEWRGSGIGTALIRGAEQLAVKAGRDLMVIGVAADNPRAAALYARLGYAESGVTATVRYDLPGPDGDPTEVIEHTRVLVKRHQPSR